MPGVQAAVRPTVLADIVLETGLAALMIDVGVNGVATCACKAAFSFSRRRSRRDFPYIYIYIYIYIYTSHINYNLILITYVAMQSVSHLCYVCVFIYVAYLFIR